MRIAVVGTGYVGLVTGVCLADVGHQVTCIDVEREKVEQLKKGISPIYEPGLEELISKNYNAGRLSFTADLQEGYQHAEVVYIAVGTPQREDGKAELKYIERVAKDIAAYITNEVIVVTKSTVPVGTNELIKEIIIKHKQTNFNVDIVSNPEFLREGSAIQDTFNGDRIVIGAENEATANVIAKINEPFRIPIFKTDIKSAEMIKYASNAFLATKISFVNEIANICEKLGANIEDVANGMGMDDRIGHKFLNAGIGYGGSCFPKDTNALVQIAGNVKHEFELLKSVIKVNNNQQKLLVEKAKDYFGSLKGKKIAVLGLAFKPNTDDMREAASIIIINELVKEDASVVAYDPIAIENAKKFLPKNITYTLNIEDALQDADMVFILTEWNQIKSIDVKIFKQLKTPVVFDGRNCFALDEMRNEGIEYFSIGRPSITGEKVEN